jgi:adenylate cyclase class 2
MRTAFAFFGEGSDELSLMTAHDHNEVEIKFLVNDAAALARSLQSAGFQEQTASTFEANTLFDTASGDLRRAQEILRLRVYGGIWTLTHKSRGTAGKHKSRAEHETAVADGEEIHAILTALGYRPAFRYEKFRAEWADGTGEVVIDRTPIGDVAEIEGAPQWIDRIAGILNLRESNYITASYAELFFQWKERTRSAALNMTFEECGTPRP